MTKPFYTSAIALVLCVAFSTATAREKGSTTTRQPEPAFRSAQANGPATAFLNINNWQLQVKRDGFFPWDGTPNGSAGDYPKGTGNVVFAEGMLWGAKVDDGQEPSLRVNGATYATGMKAGKVLYDGSGNVTGSDDPEERHVWRVRRDYATADLGPDAASSYVKNLDDVTAAEIQAIYDQYEYDWQNWPADEGAPFDDVDGDGAYDPSADIPGYPGAAQTIWLVANDLPYDDGSEVATTSYGSPAIGIEMQLTLWAYDFAATHPLGNMLFKQARLIYTGLVGGPSTAKMDTVYFAQWSDPDLGTYTDDYVGSDTTLSLGYVYNGNTLDSYFNGDFGLPVPAGGYDFLQGPITDPDGDGNPDTLGMTSFTYFGAGSSISDPDLGEYSGTLQFFNLMEGFLPRPEYPEQQPWTDPITGQTTKFVLAGDPVTGEGWVDGIQLPPGDRRLVMATGPFQMMLGDTQDVVLALVGGMGSDNLSSITVMKYFDTFAQFAYDNYFELPGPPARPVVTAHGGDEAISLYWGNNADAVAATEEDTIKGFAFEGYNIYQLPSASASSTEGEKIATYDAVNGVIVIMEDQVDTETGQVISLPAQVGSDGGIVRNLMITTDALRSRPITNDIPYYFGVSAYSSLAADIESPFNSLESSMSVVSVIPQKEGLGYSYSAYAGDTLEVGLGTTNKSDGSVYPIVIDPTAFTDATYAVTFNSDLSWNLLENGTAIQDSLTNQTGDNEYPMVNGLMVKVLGPPLQGKSWNYTGGTGTGARWFTAGSGADGELVYGGAYLGPNFTGSSVAPAEFKTVEIRWGAVNETGLAPCDAYTVDLTHANSSYAYRYRTWGAGKYLGFSPIPFSAWDTEAEPDRQLTVVVRDRDQNGQWDLMSDNCPYNYVWILDDDYDAAGTDWNPGAGGQDFMGQVDIDGGPVLWALWLGQRGSRELFSDPGGILTLEPNRVNSPLDTFTFTTAAPAYGADKAEADIEKINVFPNPYYGFHALEQSRAVKWMRFNHLPEQATIRIFNLGGTMVRVIEKDDESQYAEWDLKNQNGYPVASGIYIAHIDLPDQNKAKVLKLAIVQEEQILRNY